MKLAEMKFSTMLFEEVEAGIGLITLNRPESLNSISVEMLEEFDTLFTALTREESVRVLVLTGSGRGFCSGADLSAALTHQEKEPFADPEHFLKLVQERFGDLIIKMRRLPQPLIAAVNGAAAGGGFSMALACDIRVAAPEAYFVASFANIGLSGGELGTSYLLPRLVGLSRAADVLFTGRKLRADEAERIGLLSGVVPREELLETALGYARQMTSKSVGGLKFTKRVLDQNLTAQSLEAAINLENRNQTILVFSRDFFNLIKGFSK